MRRMTLKSCGWMAGTALLVGVAQAGPLRTEWVAPDSTWVMHLDAEALFASSLGQGIVQMVGGPEGGIFEEAQREIGLNPARDVFGVTAFAVGEDETTFTVILEATSAIDQLLLKAPEMGAGYRSFTEADKTIHAWKDDGEEWFAYVKNGATPDRRVVMVSQDMLRLRAGLVRLEARGVAGEPCPALRNVQPGAGCIAFLSATEFPHIDEDMGPANALLKDASGLVAEVSETNGKLRMNASVDTGNAEQASNALMMIQGLMAAGRMMASSQPEFKDAMPLFNSIRVNADGDVMRASFEYDSAKILNLIEAEVKAEIERDEHGKPNANGKVTVRKKTTVKTDSSEEQPQ